MGGMNSVAVLAAALALVGCAPGTQMQDAAHSASGAIAWQQVLAAGKVPGSDAALKSLLADSSHEIRFVTGREQRYFAADGSAVFRNVRTGATEAGWWATQPSRAFGHFICAARGARPASLAGSVLADDCEFSSDWVGSADNLTRGDAYGLRGTS